MFSEVDAVLDSPNAPAFTKAASVLKRLGDDVAVVLVSGKTRAELQFIQQKLDLTHPFVCENGGAVLIPDGYFSFTIPNGRAIAGYDAVEFGRSYDEVVELLHRAADRLRIQIVGFHDMSIEEVARECDLPLLQARLAKLREYEEPFRIVDGGSNARSRLFKALQASSLHCARGAAFDRVTSAVDPDVCVSLLKGLYRRQSSVTTVGLTSGDDSQLLRLVEHAATLAAAPDTQTVDALGWANVIADTVQAVRRRSTGESGGALMAHTRPA